MKWISVKKKLPHETEFIIVWGSHVMPWLCQFLEGKFKDIEDGDYLTGITHWMPLPNPPTIK